MAKITLEMPLDGVKQLLAQLTPQELRAVLAGLRNRLETLDMMKLDETAFSEWTTEEDLYSNG